MIALASRRSICISLAPRTIGHNGADENNPWRMGERTDAAVDGTGVGCPHPPAGVGVLIDVIAFLLITGPRGERER